MSQEVLILLKSNFTVKEVNYYDIFGTKICQKHVSMPYSLNQSKMVQAVEEHLPKNYRVISNFFYPHFKQSQLNIAIERIKEFDEN